MVYITGDCHADFYKFSTHRFADQKDMTTNDFVIVCGDFGIWEDNPTERWWLDWLAEKRFTVLFVDGNHENFDRLYSEFDVVDFHGGKAHKIRNNIYHLMRGHVFNLCGKKFFAFGGASSHDIEDGILDRDDFKSKYELIKEYNRRIYRGEMIRINHISWWKEELPSQEEMDFGVKTLEDNGNKVDFIVSHCCPQEIASIISLGSYKPDVLTSYFNKIANTVEFSKWFFGHYHNNTQVMNNFVMLYDQIERVV